MRATVATIRGYSILTSASTAAVSLDPVTAIHQTSRMDARATGDQGSAISRSSAVTVQKSSWHSRNRLVHSSASALSLAWRMA